MAAEGGPAAERGRLAAPRPPPEGCDSYSGAYRVCVDCELKYRTQRWDFLPAAARAAKPYYATYQGVRRDQKMANKGRLWLSAGQHINNAKQEVKEGRGLEDSLKGHRRKKQYWIGHTSWQRRC